ncbi:MAG: hypothetical protein AB8E82_07225 [Aureispira sp.]
MSFESNIESKNYGVNARKPVSVDVIKKEAYDAIKKLEKVGLEVRVSYFLHNNYYEGGVPFLAIGESNGLIRKFEQYRRSDDVSYGYVYIEKEQNRNVIYFEHVYKQGKLSNYSDWEKVLKTLEVWLKAECRFVIEDEDFDEEEDAKRTPSKVRANNAKKTKKEPVLPENVKEMTEDFHYMISAYEDMTEIQNDPHNFVKFYQTITKQQEKLKTLPKKEQNQLSKLIDLDLLKEEIAQRLKFNKDISKELDVIFSLTDEYQQDFDFGKKVDISVAVGQIEMIARFIDDFEILEQMQELKTLLDNSFVHSL